MNADDVLLNAPMYFQPLEGSEAKDAVLSNKDLLLRIFFNLQFKFVATSAMVCKAWHAVASSKEFWSTVNMEGRPVTLEQVRMESVAFLGERFFCLLSLHFWNEGKGAIMEKIICVWVHGLLPVLMWV
jgi:F-box-like